MICILYGMMHIPALCSNGRNTNTVFKVVSTFIALILQHIECAASNNGIVFVLVHDLITLVMDYIVYLEVVEYVGADTLLSLYGRMIPS